MIEAYWPCHSPEHEVFQVCVKKFIMLKIIQLYKLGLLFYTRRYIMPIFIENKKSLGRQQIKDMNAKETY